MNKIIFLSMLFLYSCSHNVTMLAEKPISRQYDQNASLSCFQDGDTKIINFYGIFSDKEKDFIRLNLFPIFSSYHMSADYFLNGENDLVNLNIKRSAEYKVVTRECLISNKLNQKIRVTTQKMIKVNFLR